MNVMSLSNIDTTDFGELAIWRHLTGSLTSRVIVKPIRHSFIRKNSFGSISLFSDHCNPALNLETTASQSSSSSNSERKLFVVFNTCVSTMKNPVISWVYERKDARGNGDGRMRSD